MPYIGNPSEDPTPQRTTLTEEQCYYVAKRNDLIQQSRFSLSVLQSKLLLFLISKIKPDDTGEETYSIALTEFCDVCNIERRNGQNIINAKQAIKSLADKSVWVKQEDGSELLLRWLNHVKWNPKNRCFEVKFHEDMLPYLYDLQSKYTTYTLDNVLTMDSKYALRLYELLQSYRNMSTTITFTIAELRDRLDVTSYPRYYDFKRNVLDQAVSGINASTDMHVEYLPSRSQGSSSTDLITFLINALTDAEFNLLRYHKQTALTPAGKERRKRRAKIYSDYVKQKQQESQE